VPSSRRVARMIDPAGLAITFGYDGAGRLTSITDPMGRVSQVSRPDSTTWRVHGPDGRQHLQVRYAASGRIWRWTDARQENWDVQYDTVSKRVSRISAPAVTVNGVTARQHTDVRSREAALLPLAGTGRTAGAPGRRITGDSAVLTVTGPRGLRTRVRTDAFGLATSISGPQDGVAISRNARGQVTAVVTRRAAQGMENGIHYFRYEPTYPYRLVENWVTGVDGGVRYEYEYGVHSQVSVVRTNLTDERRYVLDALGRRTHVLRGVDTVASFVYDAQGRVTSQTDFRGTATAFEYQGAGTPQNLRRVTRGGIVTEMRYDAFGRSVSSIHAGTASDSVGYDVLNRVRWVRDRVGGVTRFTFGNGVDADTVIDARGQRYLFSHNVLGMVTAERDPAGLWMQTTLDPATLLPAQVTNRRGQVTSFQHDSLGRVTARTAGGQTTHWRYGPNQRWMVAENAVGADSLVFDPEGKLVETHVRRGSVQLLLRTAHAFPRDRPQPDTVAITGPWGTSTTLYGYNSRGQLATARDVSGRWTTLRYDRWGRLDSLRLPTSPVARNRYTRTSEDRLAAVVSTISGLTRAYAYSPRGLLLQDSTNAPGAARHRYEYDAKDRVRKWDLVHTALERVCDDPRNCWWEHRDSVAQSATFAWDSVGNPRGAPLGLGNRLLAHAGFSMAYDADGNLVRKLNTATGVRDTLVWNALGQLTGVQRTGGPWITYEYDGLGRRARRVNQGTGAVVLYVYHRDDLVLELDGAGNRIREYTYLPGIDRPHSMRQWANGEKGAMYYYQLQTPGHVNALLDLGGNVVNHYRYTPFGTPANGFPVEGTPNPLQYMARELDATTGLYYVRNRWYDPQVGRFVSEDPIGLAGGMNVYVYAKNNPLSYIDPLGLEAVCVDWYMLTVDTRTGEILDERYVTTTCSEDDSSRSNRSNTRCTVPPPLPAGASVNSNILTAERQLSLIRYATLRLPGLTTIQAGRWFMAQVDKNMPWDYASTVDGTYQPGGNFNYGATGAALQFSSQELLRMAGLAQRRNPGSAPEHGVPWGRPPYGDEPEDQTWIRLGIDYYRGNCHRAPPPN
jgi:RHS repeat-associated protein